MKLMSTSRVLMQVIIKACIGEQVSGGAYLSNCLEKAAEGADNCANKAEEWGRLWELSDACVRISASRFP